MAIQDALVLAQDGYQGTLHWYEPDDKGQVVVKFEGHMFTVPSHLLSSDDSGDYVLELAAKDLLAGHYDYPQHDHSEQHLVQENSPEHDSSRLGFAESYVIPQVKEQLTAVKTSTTEQVTVKKTIDEREETIEVPLTRSELDVQLIEINKPIEHAPDVRTEGDTTIIPVLVERLVTQKQLFLKAEMHITKRQKIETHRETHTLKEETISVERNTQTHDTDNDVHADQLDGTHVTNEEVISNDAVSNDTVPNNTVSNDAVAAQS